MDIEEEIKELKERVDFLEIQNDERFINEIKKIKLEMALIDFNKKLNGRLNKLYNETF